MNCTKRVVPAVLFLLAAVLVAACSKAVGDAADGVQEGLSAASESGNSFGGALASLNNSAEPADLGPGYRVLFQNDSVVLVIEPSLGDSVNALQPPVLQLKNGERFVFGGTSVGSDSAYFTSEVTLALPISRLPVDAVLHTSYCRAGERLCRSAARPVLVKNQ